jgi:ATP-dependent helicase HepA
MTDFKAGQKWISNAEPELGMGRIIRLEHRQVSCYFDLVGEERTYSRSQAPLTRVRFNPGDKVQTLDGITITVSSVVDHDEIFIYHGDYNGTNTAVIETELDPNVRFSKPEERLFTHQLDDNQWFNLRYHTLIQVARLCGSRSQGLYGPRVSLIPHQFYIASEVAGRFAPRVLLADEVGLGKTIEAGLIIHQQLQTGRAKRVLVVIPPALTFQWFVEMIRRFNLQFTVLDEDRCQQIIADNTSEDDEPGLDNPFEAQQLVLCSLDLFIDNSGRLQEAIRSKWDLVVVDEAHHLKWTPEGASTEYRIVEELSCAANGLLLLTATPEQLGRAGHFARLRLLDPDRYHDYETFLSEEASFQDVAGRVNDLLDGNDEARSAARKRIVAMLDSTDSTDDEQLIAALLDRHGTGRVLFRNVRTSVAGFTRRIVKPQSLPLPSEYEDTASYFPETGRDDWTEFDPRVSWLIKLVSGSAEKFLVICAHQKTARQLEQHIRNSTVIRSTVFHEGMDLIARDRSASYFSETYKGAQVMICSEIGSEGRNFQFASQLVLFDLPLGPDLLEQRIGRLDRIGQSADVSINIPFMSPCRMADLFRWYHEAMDLFAEPNPVGQNIFDELFETFAASSDIDLFISQAAVVNHERRASVNSGRDRLLELNSHRLQTSSEILMDVLEFEGGRQLEHYMEMSFDAFGLESEPLGDGVHSIKPTESMIRHTSVSIETLDHFHYPELPEDGISITYDRDIALAREDVGFFTWENPMVQQALDVVLTDITGNSAMIAIKHAALTPGTLLVEVLHVVHCIAPAEIMADRYLPPLVIRSLITPELDDISDSLEFNEFENNLSIPAATLHSILDSQASGLREMLAQAQTLAGERLKKLVRSAMLRMTTGMDMEINRLKQLRKVNDSVRPEELEFLNLRKDRLAGAIEDTQMRMDAIRVIVAA